MIDFGRCLNFAIERLKKNPVFYVVGFLIILAAQQCLSMVAQVGAVGVVVLIEPLLENVEAAEQASESILVCAILVFSTVLWPLLAPLWVGYVKGIRREIDGGSGEIKDVVSEFGNFLPIALNYFVGSGVVMGGFICCIIPGFLLAPLPYVSSYLLAGGQTRGIDAFKSAWRLLWRNPIIIPLSLVTVLVAISGVFACCIGLFVTIPIGLTAQCMLIQQVIDRERQPLTPPALPS